MALIRRDPLPIASSVTPITDNPKAVRFSYQVKVRITDGTKFFTPTERRELEANKVDTVISALVRSELYEFNHFHSKELAEFWNPLDSKQNGKFKELVQTFLQLILDQNGLTLTKTSFDVG